MLSKGAASPTGELTVETEGGELTVGVESGELTVEAEEVVVTSVGVLFFFFLFLSCADIHIASCTFSEDS